MAEQSCGWSSFGDPTPRRPHEDSTLEGRVLLEETLAAMPGMLLAICGHEADPQEEIWARQLGVWLYLPGLSTQHVGEISVLCEQAQLMAGGTKASH